MNFKMKAIGRIRKRQTVFYFAQVILRIHFPPTTRSLQDVQTKQGGDVSLLRIVRANTR
jgi:hypothetical protein